MVVVVVEVVFGLVLAMASASASTSMAAAAAVAVVEGPSLFFSDKVDDGDAGCLVFASVFVFVLADGECAPEGRKAWALGDRRGGERRPAAAPAVAAAADGGER